MSFGTDNFENLLGGSYVSFRKRERPALSEPENQLKLTNEGKLREGIYVLRQLRTRALEDTDPAICQNTLVQAHEFSSQMANVIINQSLLDNPGELDSSFTDKLRQLKETYKDQDAASGHSIPGSYSAQNLLRATDDIFVRIEEKLGSVTKPKRKLTRDETKDVLKEFLKGTNDLTVDAISSFFEKNTRIGGILTGGSVYLEVVKKIVERYADTSLAVNSFVIAVDKDNKKAVFELSDEDLAAQSVVITDDVIDGGGTVLTALWAAGQHFPNATIHSGKGIDYPGEFEKRRSEIPNGHLFGLFQDFADLIKEKKDSEALELFEQARVYAEENDVELQRGWYANKERIENGELARLRFLSDELDTLQAQKNDGRGVTHLRYVVEDLKRGNLSMARGDIANQSDKFDSIPDIKEWVVEKLFSDSRHPWETEEGFKKRMETKSDEEDVEKQLGILQREEIEAPEGFVSVFHETKEEFLHSIDSDGLKPNTEKKNIGVSEQITRWNAKIDVLEPDSLREKGISRSNTYAYPHLEVGHGLSGASMRFIKKDEQELSFSFETLRDHMPGRLSKLGVRTFEEYKKKMSDPEYLKSQYAGEVLELKVDPQNCYVGDLEYITRILDDMSRGRLEDEAIERQAEIYWDGMITLADFLTWYKKPERNSDDSIKDKDQYKDGWLSTSGFCLLKGAPENLPSVIYVPEILIPDTVPPNLIRVLK